MNYATPDDDLTEYRRCHSDEAACARHREPDRHSKPNTNDYSCHNLDEDVDVLLLSSDSGSEQDVPKWINMTKHVLVKHKKYDNGVSEFLVRKQHG